VVGLSHHPTTGIPIVLIIPPPIDRYHPPRSASEAVGHMALLGGVV
jgi:hypothetical protein